MNEVIEDRAEKAAMRAVETMRERLGEQLTIDDLAHAAIFSKFHFSRVFQRVTGLSPGRFLSALRLQEAKRLLRATPLSITDISIQVGYASVGTFSSRFKDSVGLSPTDYRRLGRVTLPAGGVRDGGTVRGHIASPLPERPVFAGLFPDRILRGRPVSCTVLHRPGPYVLRNVPSGSWHLIAFAGEGGLVEGDETYCLGTRGPIEIGRSAGDRPADLRLRPVRPLDPPVLLALDELLSLRNPKDVAAVSGSRR